MLQDALRQVGIATIADVQMRGVGGPPAPSDVIILIIDQFEEFFSQSMAAERQDLFVWLAHLPPFAQAQLHIVATLRSDHLDELHEVDVLFEIQRQSGLALHKMSVEQLKRAIVRPLQSRLPSGAKIFESALVNKLAHDASLDAGLLPLLQVTLEDIWNKGELKLSAYGNLTDAIKDRAERVYEYEDFESPSPQKPRNETDRAAILSTFVALLNVSPTGLLHRDVRKGRVLEALTRGGSDRLINDLVRARLLSKTTEEDEPGSAQGSEVVNIIHESLIGNWERLRKALQDQLRQRQQSARFEQHLSDWHANNQSKDYLLSGVSLTQARELSELNDIALRDELARKFLGASTAEAQRGARIARRRRYAIAITIISALLVALGVVVARWRNSVAQRLVFQSMRVLRNQPDVGLLLAEQAAREGLFGRQAEQREGLLSSVQRSSNQLLAYLREHTDRAWDVGFNHDVNNLRVASVGDDGRLVIWDVATRRKITATHGANTGTSLYSVAYSPDDRVIAAGDGDGQIIFWDAETLRMTAVITPHRANVLSIAFSADGTRLVSGGNDGDVAITEVKTGKVITKQVAAHSNWIWSVAFSPDNRTVASGGRDNRIVLWDTQAALGTIAVTTALTNHPNIVTSLSFVAVHGKALLASGDAGGRVMLWDATHWPTTHARLNPLHRLNGAMDSIIWGLSFSPDGQKLLGVSNSGYAQVWQLDLSSAAGTPALTKLTGYLRGHAQSLRGEFAPDGKTFATSSFEGLVALWQAEPGNAFIGHNSAVLAVQRSATGNRIATISGNARVKQWDVASRTATQTIELAVPRPITLTAAAFSRDGVLVAGVYSATAFVWDGATGSLRHTLTAPHTRTINVVAFGANGVLATGDADGRIVLWNVETGKDIAKQQVSKGQIYRLVFSNNGKVLASGGCRVPNRPDIREPGCGRNEVRLWDAATLGQLGEPLAGKSGLVSALAFDAQDTRLAVGTQDETVTVWELQTRTPVAAFKPDDGDVTQLAFDPNGTELAVATLGSRNIGIWDLASQRLVGDLFRDHRGRIQTLFYSPDGKVLYSSADDGMAMIWDMDMTNWHARVCRMTNRNLTNAEWQQYVGDIFYRKTCPEND
jgi:WD40 repeat protein